MPPPISRPIISTYINHHQSHPIRIYPQVGPTLGYVTRSEKLYSCCAATAYSLPLGPLELPATAVAFRIAINTSGAGELPYGAPVLYSDRTETEVMSTLKPITNSCALESVEIQPMNHCWGLDVDGGCGCGRVEVQVSTYLEVHFVIVIGCSHLITGTVGNTIQDGLLGGLRGCLVR